MAVLVKLSKTYARAEGHTRGRPGQIGGSVPRSGQAPGYSIAHLSPAEREERKRKINEAWNKRVADNRDFLTPIISDSYSGSYTPEQNIRFANKLFRDATKKQDKLSGEVIKDAWEVDDKASGLKSEVHAVINNRNDDTVSIMGRVKNENGSVVGRFTRTVYRDGHVYNSYFSMNDDMQGTGFGSQLYRNAEVVLKKAGFDRVEISANIDVGGYAWAKMGFDFKEDYQANSFKNDLISFVTRNMESRFAGQTAEQYDKHKAIITNAINTQLSSRPRAWEIAAFNIPGWTKTKNIYNSSTKIWEDVPMHLGKAFMLGKGWSAVKYLKDQDPGYKIGEQYYKAKAKKKKPTK